MLPVEVLESLSKEMLDYQGTGLSLMEVSHRDAAYDEVHHRVTFLIKDLMGVPEDYSVLLIGGGATLQFSMLPMNLLPPGGRADYVNSGAWSQKAITEAEKVGRVEVVWDGAGGDFTTLPNPADLKAGSESSYFHITSNETIGGIQWKSFPDTGEIPLVADMSSDILSRPLDVSQFDLIYAGAQKNLGSSGVTLVILKDKLLERCPGELGAYLNYAVHARSNSLYNTPPVFPIWVMKLTLENLKKRGGAEAVGRENRAKAAELYQTIENSGGFYRCLADPMARSDMNIVWLLPDEETQASFLREAKSAGLIGLKGHRSVGGCRASLYNAMSMEGVRKLTDFMKDFAKK